MDTNTTSKNSMMTPSSAAVVIAGTIIVASSIAVAFFLLRYLLRRHRTKRADESAKKCIYPYLTNFDVNDMALCRAPTGGWHATYLNKLAFGINDYDTDTESESSYGDSSKS